MLPFLLALQVCASTPLPDGDRYVPGLVGTQRQREETLSRYTYDVAETREQLDGAGRVKRLERRDYEVFYVKGRPVRRLVARHGRPLSEKDRRREQKRVEALAEAIRGGRAAREQPGVRISAILERYRFRALRREEVDGRCALVFDFDARPGRFDLERDGVLRRLAGRLWVDEEEQAVVRVDVRSTDGIKIALGFGASVRSLSAHLAFRRMENAVWLPAEVEVRAEGRRLLVQGFRTRIRSTYSGYRRFSVDVEESVRP